MSINPTGSRQGTAKVQKLSERSKSGARAEQGRRRRPPENKMKSKRPFLMTECNRMQSYS